MRAKITTNHLAFRSLYMQNALNVNSYNAVRQEKIVVGFSGNIYTGTINKLDIGDRTIEERHLKLGAVTTSILADGSVTEDKIRDSNVTLQKLEPSIREIFREVKPNMNVIVATKDVNNDYHVSQRIYAKDFVVENPDGTLVNISSTIIDDSKTTANTTWSSIYINNMFSGKSDTGHTHSGYSLSGHTHIKGDISDFPTSLPANGGNSATVGGVSINDIFITYNNTPSALAGHNSDGTKIYYYGAEGVRKMVAGEGKVLLTATPDVNSDYHLDRKIYAKDFIVENADGSLSDIISTIINDSQTSSLTTWSSVLIDSRIREKSDIGHTHEQYPLISHTHSKSQITDFPASVPASGGTADRAGVADMLKSENIIRYNINGLQYFNSYTIGNGLNGNTVATPYGENWSHNIIMTHPNPAGYYTQISTPFHTDDIKFRRMYAGAFGGWQTLYHSGNVNNYDTDWNCKELKTKGRASIGQQDNGTCIIDAYNGYAFYGCNNPENGIKIDTNGTTTTKNLIVNPALSGSYNEGLRLVKHSNGWSNINFGTDTSDKGFISGQWVIGKGPDNTFLITSVGNENGTNNLRIDSSGVAYCKDIIAIG